MLSARCVPAVARAPALLARKAVLVTAGSTDAKTDVAVDLDEIAAVTGLPVDVVGRKVAPLVGAAAADWT